MESCRLINCNPIHSWPRGLLTLATKKSGSTPNCSTKDQPLPTIINYQRLLMITLTVIRVANGNSQEAASSLTWANKHFTPNPKDSHMITKHWILSSPNLCIEISRSPSHKSKLNFSRLKGRGDFYHSTKTLPFQMLEFRLRSPFQSKLSLTVPIRTME